MPNISSETVSSVIGDIYEAAHDHTAWLRAIENLRRMFDGSKACLVRVGPNLQLSDSVAANTDPEFTTRFINEFADEPNVLKDAVMAAPVGLIYGDHALVGHERLRATRFWNDWMAPQDMYGGLACKLFASGSSSWFFDVQRGRNQTAFDAADVKLFRAVAPHIRRSVEIGRKVQTTQALASTFSRLPFGIILVDEHQRIVTMNDAAEAVLAQSGSGLHQRSKHLVADDARSAKMLERLISDVCACSDVIAPGLGGDFLIASKSNSSRPMTLSVSVSPFPRDRTHTLPLEPCAVVLVRDMTLDLPAGFEKHLQHLFCLSPRQAQLAALLSSGRTLKQAAADQGIKFSTARSNLEEVFRRTGTHQQSQLVALLKSTHPLGKAQ